MKLVSYKEALKLGKEKLNRQINWDTSGNNNHNFNDILMFNLAADEYRNKRDINEFRKIVALDSIVNTFKNKKDFYKHVNKELKTLGVDRDYFKRISQRDILNAAMKSNDKDSIDNFLKLWKL